MNGADGAECGSGFFGFQVLIGIGVKSSPVERSILDLACLNQQHTRIVLRFELNSLDPIFLICTLRSHSYKAARMERVETNFKVSNLTLNGGFMVKSEVNWKNK